MTQTTTSQTGELTRPERLDRLRFSRKHFKLLTGSGVGWALDAMDVGLISFILAILIKQWGMSPTQGSVIASAGFLGMAIGASVGGLLADRIGRRTVFALTLVVYGVATGVSALTPAPSETIGVWTAVLILSGLRLIVGLGLGAELPVASTLVSEFSPARIRGRIIVLLEAFWALGWVAAAVIAYFLVPASEAGWRWAFALGAGPALYAIVIRRGLPESVRFLERRGRTEEAEQVVRSFEADQGVEPVSSPPAQESPPPKISALFNFEFRGRTIALWLVWFGVNFAYYGAFIWMPTLLVQAGFPLVRSFGFTLIITLAQIPGYAVSAFLIEKWGRRATLATFLLGSAASAIAFGLSTSEAAVLIAGCSLSFFNLGAWGALYAVTPEIYPTTMRGTGSGGSAAFGRLASIIAPLVVPVLAVRGGLPLVFIVLSGAFAMATVAAMLLPEWRGRQLEET
ncbi:MAG: MFS transporter [Propionibacteriales bacterium]|nr:MFS transporter [Propionibacteriales bacterium]